MNNRIHNCRNPNQGSYRKILCVCSAGLLRSPTLALALAQQGHNTRAAGSASNFALIPVDEVLIAWADEIVFVNRENYNDVAYLFKEDLARYQPEITVLNIPDIYPYRDPRLVQECITQYEAAHAEQST